MAKIRVLMVDDYRLVMEAWATILASDGRFEVVGQAYNATEAYTMASEKQPDVVVVDINLNPAESVEIIRMVGRYSPLSRVIGVAGHSFPAYAKKMIQAGAKGYITRNSPKEELIAALLSVRNGIQYICEDVKQEIMEEQFRLSNTPGGLRRLTRTELEIIQVIKEGLSSREIALKFHISIKTVEVHRYNILRKLNIRNVAALVNFVNAQGL